MKNSHHNLDYHETKMQALLLLSEGLKLKDESASELNRDKSDHLAKLACENFHNVNLLFNKNPQLAGDMRDHPHLYELRHFARKNGM